MGNISFVTREKVEYLSEIAARLIDTFVKVCGPALLIALIFSDVWKSRSLAESAGKGRLRRGMLSSCFQQGESEWFKETQHDSWATLWAHLWSLVLYLKRGGLCGVEFFSSSLQPHGGSRECGEGCDLLGSRFYKADFSRGGKGGRREWRVSARKL